MFSTIPPEKFTQTSAEKVSTEGSVYLDDSVLGKTQSEQERPVLDALMKVCKETSERTVSLHWINIQKCSIAYDPKHIKTLSTRMKLSDSHSLGVIPIQSLLLGSQILPLGIFLGASFTNPDNCGETIMNFGKTTGGNEPIWFGDIVMAPPDIHKVICSVVLK